MKKLICVFFLLQVLFSLSFAEGIAERAEAGNAKADMSYAFGMIFASDLIGSGMEFNYSSLMKGFREVIEEEETRYTMDEAMDVAQAAYRNAMERQANENSYQEAVFFAENGRRDGVITAPSGLQYEVLVEGTGKEALASSYVRVNYQGALLNGTIFDSSYSRGEPEEFPLQGVIPGFSEGIQYMKEGGRSRLYIPSNLAYGSRGIGNIPPNSTLVFEVELLEVMEAPEDDFYYDYDLDFDYDFEE